MRVRGKEERVELRYDNTLNLTDKVTGVHEQVSICRMYLQRGDGGDVLEASLLIFQVISLWSLVPLAHLPQFDGLIFVERESTAQEADQTDRKLTKIEFLTKVFTVKCKETL